MGLPKNEESIFIDYGVNLADSIVNLMKKKGVSDSDVARALGLPYNTIKRITSGETTDPKLSTLSLIAEYFSVAIDQLLDNSSHGSNIQHGRIASGNFLSIPIISWQNAINPEKAIDNLSTNNHEEWLAIDGNASPTTFGLRSKPCMKPRFHTGSILIVDPKVTPCDGDLIIVYYKNTAEATIRQIVLDGLKQRLQSLINCSETDDLSPEIALLGVVVQTRYLFK